MKQASRNREESTEVQDALKTCFPSFAGVAVFSAVVNVLALTGSIYMLQVYDRVLSSRSIATLIGLSLITLAAYALSGGLDMLRGQDAGAHRRPLRRAPVPPRLRPRGHDAAQGRQAGREHAADPRSRQDPRLPLEPGPDGPVRHALHADLPHRLLHDPSRHRRHVGDRRRGHHHPDPLHGRQEQGPLLRGDQERRRAPGHGRDQPPQCGGDPRPRHAGLPGQALRRGACPTRQ